ncbi:hypothetical protein ACFSTD_00615 [Novosphingobium colocasiae]
MRECNLIMAAQPIRVEIIGADLEQRWANASHVPALTVDRDFDPVAVGTQTESSARVPTEQFGGPHAVNDTQSLAEHPDVAIVGEIGQGSLPQETGSVRL